MLKVNKIVLTYVLMILSFFLLLPKFPITSKQGILPGEILLAFFPIVCFLSPKEFSFNSIKNLLLGSFVIFLTLYIFISSSIGAVVTYIFPLNGYSQFIRSLLYVQIVFIVTAKSFNYYNSFLIFKIILNTYIIHLVVASLYFIYAFYVIQPSLGDILGTASAGARLIPLYGLTIQLGQEIPMNAVAGGSGNLLASHALFVLIAVYYFQRNSKFELILSLATVVVLLLAQSRGGVLTIIFWMLYRYRFNLFYLRKVKLSSFLFILILFFIVFYIIIELSNFMGVFDRFSVIWDEGALDGSSLARLQNFIEVFDLWITSPLYFFIGLGFDNSIFESITKWSLVESLFLSVLFSSGFIGFFSLLFFFYQSYLVRHKNNWASILFNFLIFNSIVNWSITGGDLLGAPALFFIILSIGLHLRETNFRQTSA